MNYDMFLFYGHGEGDNGAVGFNFNELDRAKELTKKVYDLLTSKGVNILTNIGKDQNNYYRNLTVGHTFNYKIGCSIHLNSSPKQATGSEILVPINLNNFNLENDILSGLETLGFYNRGLKSRDYDTNIFYNRKNGIYLGGKDWYKEIRNAYENGNKLSIIEVCFINNITDINMFNENIDKIAIIIANAYLKEMRKPIIGEDKRDKYMKYALCYTNEVDERFAKTLRDFLKTDVQCFDCTIPMSNWEIIAENIVAIGGDSSPIGFSSHTTHKINGKDRFITNSIIDDICTGKIDLEMFRIK